MDQSPHSRPDGFPNATMFPNSQQQFNSYDTFTPSAVAEQSSYDTTWNVNASSYPLHQSRAQAQSPSWSSHHNANRGLPGSSHIGSTNGQSSSYHRPVSQSPAPFGHAAYNGYNAPQTFHYQQSQPQYDPALLQSGHGRNFNYSTADYQAPNAATIAPQALQHDARSSAFGAQPSYQPSLLQTGSNALSNNLVDQRKLMSSIPAGTDAGLFTIVPFDALAQSTNSTRMGNFVTIGRESMNWDCNRSTVPPAYVARQSRNELRKSAGSDARALAKIGKKSVKMQRIADAPKTIQAATNASVYPSEKIKYEVDVSSDEDSSSAEEDDDSLYTSDDDAEPAPLPSKRPESAKAALEYDTIKALWRSKRKSISSDSIRKGLVDFWEIAKTIRDRWKADATAFEEAKKKNQKSQLPLLESRVKDQRDMIEVAFKAALKHGHRSIVEIMSENESLIYLCYQFLLDRFKVEDYNSPLPRTMLELMTIWTSLTEERAEKTHIGKVLARYAKYGDAKTKYYTNKITSNAAAATKEAKAKNASAEAKTAPSTGLKPGSPTRRRAEPVAGVKRAASTAAEGGVVKKVATGSTKPNGIATIAKQNGTVRKLSGSTEASKSSATAAAPATKTKTVAAKPSGIFSSLSAAKKPGTSTTAKASATGTSTASKLADRKTTVAAPKSTFSFAETMANLAKPKEEKPATPKTEKRLPPETPEEKTKRLRKESRRHLRVSFKRDDELTAVRVFTHDPDEELGHDASQMRDVSDVGGEGRMFKQQHQMMDVDDDDDEASEEEAKGLVGFKEPTPINFADVDPDERARNYTHRGGGELEVESKERAARDYYDANTLIVVYTAPEDIPPNPREPSTPYTGDAMESVKNFALPAEQYADRARQKKSAHGYHFGAEQQAPPVQHKPALPFDLSKLTGLIGQHPNMQQSPAHQQPPASVPLDISSILASLNPSNAAQATPPPLPHIPGSAPNFQPPPMYPAPSQQQAPTQQQSQETPDLAALLAQLSKQTGVAAQPPAMGGGYGMPAPAMNFGLADVSNQLQWQDEAAGGGGAGRGENNMSREIRNNPTVNRFYKTKICQFWLQGKCQKGEACSYKHSE